MTLIAMWDEHDAAGYIGDEIDQALGEILAEHGAVSNASVSMADLTMRCTVRDGGMIPISVAVTDELEQLCPVAASCARCQTDRCQHIAAALLAVASAETVTSDSASRRGKPVATWRDEIAPLLAPTRSSDSATTPLGIQFAVIPGLGYGDDKPCHLTMRLVTPGKKAAWIRSKINWDKLQYSYDLRGYDPSQLAAVQALHAVAPRDWRFYGSGNPLIVDNTDNPALWSLLEGARAVGIAFVHEGKGAEPVVLGDPVTAVLDIADQAGALRAEPRFEGTGPLPTGQIGWIGAHGVFWVEDAAEGATSGPARIALAPLTRPLPDGARQWFAEQHAVEVPAADHEDFVNDVLIPLSDRIAVGSRDGSFTPPEPPKPMLHLLIEQQQETASSEPGQGVISMSEFRKQRRNASGRGQSDADSLAAVRWRLTFCWRYGAGRAARSFPLASPAIHTTRDAQAEQDITAEVHRAAGGVAALWDASAIGVAGSPGTGLLEEAELTGAQCVRFQRDVLPLLMAIDGLSVTTRTTTLREARSDALITVSNTAQEGSTDWFDLSVTVSVDDQEVPFGPLFAALAGNEEYLVLDSGTYFSLDRPEFGALRTLIEEARALSDKPGGMSISRYQVSLWEELAALGVVQRQAAEWRAAVERLTGAVLVEGTPPPSGFAGELREYQQQGYDWLTYLHQAGLGGILADDMGLGKTVQCLALIDQVLSQAADGARRSPFLIVAPTSVVPNWVREAERFTPGRVAAAVTQSAAKATTPLSDLAKSADIIVTSYALFRIDFERYAAIDWSGLILDEAQMVKNRQAQAHQCARKLNTPFKLAVTGTPMENNVMELWSLLSITNPGLFPKPEQFRQFFAKPIESGQHPELLETLRRRIRPFMLRRTKEQVALDLPPKQEQVLELELTPAQRRIYSRHLQRERQKVMGLLGDLDANRFQIFRSLTLLRRLALDCSLVDADYASAPSAKLDAAMELIRDLASEGHRALVFSQFTSFLSLLRDRLEQAGIEAVYLDGSTQHRDRVIDGFRKGRAPVFLISLKAGGFGLNLTEADYCLMLDPWWNPASEAQAIDRTHRIGQTKNVIVYRLVAKDTIEEKVMAMKARKAALFDAVVGSDGAGPVALTADDVRELLA